VPQSGPSTVLSTNGGHIPLSVAGVRGHQWFKTETEPDFAGTAGSNRRIIVPHA
jgi:hypothetical protein